MDKTTLANVVKTCRARAAQDDPGIPVYTRKKLEEAVVALAEQRDRALSK